MKKIFINIISWFKSLFKIKKSDLELEQELLAKRFSKETFDKLKEKGVIDTTDGLNRDGLSRDELTEELIESARDLNRYKDKSMDIHNAVKAAGGIKDIDKIEGLAKDVAAKDKTELIKQEMALHPESINYSRLKKILTEAKEKIDKNNNTN